MDVIQITQIKAPQRSDDKSKDQRLAFEGKCVDDFGSSEDSELNSDLEDENEGCPTFEIDESLKTCQEEPSHDTEEEGNIPESKTRLPQESVHDAIKANQSIRTQSVHNHMESKVTSFTSNLKS